MSIHDLIHTPPWAKIPPRERPLAPSSALHWLNVVRACARAPRTEVVRFDPAALWFALEGSGVEGPIPWDDFYVAAEKVGYPCFVRTDLNSAKHAGPAVYRVEGPNDIERAVLGTFEDAALKDLAAGPWPVRAMLFREWLDLDAQFTAFGIPGKGHPIAPEWRYFAEAGTVRCAHFYWPAEAIKRPSVEDWSVRLAAMQAREVSPDVRAWAESVTQVLPGAWSIDFALDRKGRWWLIDMATARESWHPDCAVR